jgi:polar amino acid transport system substrate-binding protein
MNAVTRAALRYLAILLVVLPAAEASADGVLARAVARGGLVAAVNPDALPLAARDKSGALVGFDIDVAKAIAKRLDLPVTFVTPGWDAILAGGWSGKWDYSVSNVTPTEERSRRLEFPADYRFEAVVAVVHRDSGWALKPADLKGKRVGVAQGTTFEQYLRRDLTIYAGEEPPDYVIDNPDIRRYPNKKAALLALAQGDGAVIDAVVTSYATAQAAIAEGLAVKAVPGFLFWEPVAVAVEPGDDAFADRMEEAIESLIDDGTLSRLSIKWFGLDMTAPVLP